MMMMMRRGERLTLDDLVVGEVQVEQEEHVEQSQSPTEEETRGLTHRTGQQSCDLTGDHTQTMLAHG